MDLTLEQLLDDACIKQLRVGRLKLIEGTPPAEFFALLGGEPLPTQEPPPPALEVVGPPVVVDLGGGSPDEKGVDPGADDAPKEPEKAAVPWTAEALEALGFREVQSIARGMGLPTGGKEAEIIKRILDAQQPLLPEEE